MNSFGVGHRIAHSALCFFSPTRGELISACISRASSRLPRFHIPLFLTSHFCLFFVLLIISLVQSFSISAKGDLFLPLPFAPAFATSLSLFLLSLYLFFLLHISFLYPFSVCFWFLSNPAMYLHIHWHLHKVLSFLIFSFSRILCCKIIRRCTYLSIHFVFHRNRSSCWKYACDFSNRSK